MDDVVDESNPSATAFLGKSRQGISNGLLAPDPTTLLGKVALLLGAFTADNATLGISEISRLTGISKSTVHRLCIQMTDLRLLDRSFGEYRLGLHLFELGALVQRQRLLQELAGPFLQDLRTKTNETVHLGIPSDGEVVYVVRLAGHQTHTAPSRVAGRAPMHCTATGKAMLAHLPDEMVEELMAGPLAAVTQYTVVNRAQLAEQLSKVRDEGIAVEDQENTLTFRSIAAPVFGPGRRLLGAVSVTGPTHRLSVDTTASLVMATARNVSARAATCWDLV